MWVGLKVHRLSSSGQNLRPCVMLTFVPLLIKCSLPALDLEMERHVVFPTSVLRKVDFSAGIQL